MPRVASFAAITKMTITLVIATYKDSVKVKRIRNNVSKCNFCLYLYLFSEKMLMSAVLKDVSRDL